MKKLISIIAVVMLFGSTVVFAGGVTDDNSGNLGDILVSTGENNGANSVGTWTDPSFLKGEQGETGATGQQGEQGVAGQDGANGVDGKDGAKGDKGVKGDTGKGLKDRYNVLLGARLYDGKKWVTEVHGGRDFNNSVNIMEVRFTRKFGKSYTEKRMEELESRLNALETASNSEVYVTDNGMGIRER